MKKLILLLIFIFSAANSNAQYSVMNDDGKRADDYTVNYALTKLPVFIRIPAVKTEADINISRTGRLSINLNVRKSNDGWLVNGGLAAPAGRVAGIGVDFALGTVYALPNELTERIAKTLTPEDKLQVFTNSASDTGDFGLILVDAGALRRERVASFIVLSQNSPASTLTPLSYDILKHTNTSKGAIVPNRPVITAAANGQLDMLLKQLQNGENINETDPESGDNALIKAIRYGDNSVVKELINSGINLRHKNRYGQNALHIASHNGNYEIARLLISEGLDVNQKDFTGQTPLMYAAVSPNYHMLELLITTGAKINEQNKNGVTAFSFASMAGAGKNAKILADHGADVLIADKTGKTPLEYAIEGEHVNLVNAILENNADINYVDNAGNSALHVASRLNNLDIASNLIRNGADINLQNNFGDTPLMVALNNGSDNVAKIILENGPNLFLVNNSGKGAYDMLAGSDKGITDLLVDLIKKQDALDSNMFSAVLANDYKSVTDFLKQGARPDVTDISTGNTPLFVAVANNYKNIAEQLLKYDANVNWQNSRDNTPLIVAVTTGDENMINLLLQYGAKLDMSNVNGDTALLWAAKLNNYSIMRLLLIRGANPNIKNYEGVSPLSIAIDTGDKETEKLLRSFGAF